MLVYCRPEGQCFFFPEPVFPVLFKHMLNRKLFILFQQPVEVNKFSLKMCGYQPAPVCFTGTHKSNQVNGLVFYFIKFSNFHDAAKKRNIAGYWYWMLDTGCWILDTGCWMLDTGYRMLVAGYWILAAGTGNRLLNSFYENRPFSMP